MEKELAAQLLSLADAFGRARGLKETTVSRLCGGDGKFIPSIRQQTATFTIRKRDEVVLWFSENWPAGVEWPAGVDRPEPTAARAAS